MIISYDDNRHLRNFFQQHHQFETVIRNDIKERLPKLILQNSPKIKTAYSLRCHGDKIYEYKIIADKQLTCRVAYTYKNQTIKIIFISETIIKRQFCQLLAKTELVA